MNPIDRTVRNPVPPLVLALVLALALALAGCADSAAPYPRTPELERDLEFWTAEFSRHPEDHYFVIKAPPGPALIYWREERTVIEYTPIDAPGGGGSLAFGHTWRLDRDTVDTVDDIGGSTYVVTHRTWLGWMEACLRQGTEVVSRRQARQVARASPVSRPLRCTPEHRRRV